MAKMCIVSTAPSCFRPTKQRPTHKNVAPCCYYWAKTPPSFAQLVEVTHSLHIIMFNSCVIFASQVQILSHAALVWVWCFSGLCGPGYSCFMSVCVSRSKLISRSLVGESSISSLVVAAQCHLRLKSLDIS